MMHFRHFTTAALCATLLTSLIAGCNPVEPKAALTVTAPAAGSDLLAGDTATVIWSPAVQGAQLAYRYSAGEEWQTLQATLDANGQQARITLPTSAVSDSFRIRVSAPDGAFEAGESPVANLRYIIITAPTAGQQLTVGTTTTITWRAYTPRLSSLRLTLSTNSGQTYDDMLTGSLQPTTTSYAWTIGAEEAGTFSYPGTGCILKLRDYGNGRYYDVTAPFTIRQP